MTTRILAMVKPLALSLFAIAFFALAQGVARADEVFIAGFTNGCFGIACAPGASATSGGLTYSNSTFQGTTANGFRALGGARTCQVEVVGAAGFEPATARV